MVNKFTVRSYYLPSLLGPVLHFSLFIPPYRCSYLYRPLGNRNWTITVTIVVNKVLVIIFQSVNQNIPNPPASTKNNTEWCRNTRGRVYTRNHCIPLIAIDIFYDSLGLHAFSCVLVMYVRNYWLTLITPQGGYDSSATPSIAV